MKRTELKAKLNTIRATQFEVEHDTDALIKAALQTYKEQTGKNVIEWDWEEDDAPACVYTDYGDDYTDCYITRVEFNDAFNIIRIDLYAYYQSDTIENADLVYMEHYKQDLADAIIAELD